MSRLAYMLLLCVAPVLAQAPDRGAELDKAYEDARAAYLALQDAERKRDAGLTPSPASARPLPPAARGRRSNTSGARCWNRKSSSRAAATTRR